RICGLSTCGSPWACKSCSGRIATKRSHELRAVLESVPCAALMTFTVRHNRQDLLNEVWDAVTAAWSSVTSGAKYQAEKTLFSIAGWCRVVEVTHGSSGWHVHIHCLITFTEPVSYDLMEELGWRMFTRWQRSLGRRGFDAVAEHGLDVRRADLGV